VNPFLSAVITSLTVSTCAVVLCTVFAVPAAFALALKPFKGRETLLALLNMLLAVPTVVVGLLVYSAIRRQGPLGAAGLLFTPGAIIIGQTILAFPIMTVFCCTALRALPPAARETAQVLGAGKTRIMLTLLSEARPGIAAAVAAAFGRLIGEVGVSMILGGNIAGYTRTMTTTIALEASKGEFSLALRLGAVLLCIALAVNGVIRFLRGDTGP